MSATPRILSLNLGSHTVGLAEFHAEPNGGLVLNGYRLREILAESVNDSARNAQIAAALREMMSELHLKGGPVNYATAAQSVFGALRVARYHRAFEIGRASCRERV